MPTFGIVVHGGAGAITKSAMTPEPEKHYHAGMNESLTNGLKTLESGDSVLACSGSLAAATSPSSL